MHESIRLSSSDAAVDAPGAATVWRIKSANWALLAVGFGLLALIFAAGLVRLFAAWEAEEYSHGYMLPLITAILIWQKSTLVAQTPFRSNWLGVVAVLCGLLVYVVGELTAIYALIQYAFLITLGGFLLGIMGWQAFRIIAPALALLFFAVPLPKFLYYSLAAELQLISSQLGVEVIRLFGIPVFLEGNVIDLGGFKLQVVEACSGLRYLFPLAALGYISAYLFNGAFWKKVVLLLSTVPIAVLMNSIRIGVIGVLVEYGGSGMAEGFLHDFEGWAVFMACTALLVLLMWLLARIGKDPIPLKEAFAITGPAPLPADASLKYRTMPAAFWVIVSALVLAAVFSQVFPQRVEVAPNRADLLFFPSALGEWQGRTDQLDKMYIDALKFDDYFLSDYTDHSGASINLYVAYYASQRKGAAVHSPKTCLPGGGWLFKEFSQREIAGARGNGEPLLVNRALIQMGDERLLVYYWFQQRGRFLTNEYQVKWYLLWDALTRNRTDGALVRLTTRLAPGQDPAEADALLSGFAAEIADPLRRSVPD